MPLGGKFRTASSRKASRVLGHRVAPGSWTCKSPRIHLLVHPKGQAQAKEPQEPGPGSPRASPPLPPTLCLWSTVYSGTVPSDHHKPGKSVLLTPLYGWANRGSERRGSCPRPHGWSAVEWRFESRLAVASRPLALSHLATCLHWNPTIPPSLAHQGQTPLCSISKPTTHPRAQPQPTPSLSNTSSHQVSCWPLCLLSCSSSRLGHLPSQWGWG